jgi:ankyrin repeat protein
MTATLTTLLLFLLASARAEQVFVRSPKFSHATIDDLIAAAREGRNADVMEMLRGPSNAENGLAAGDKSNAGETPLFVAAYWGQTTTMELLIKTGADVDQITAEDEDAMTALHAAAQEGRVGAVDVLLSQSANPNITDSHGRTPMMIAAYDGAVPIIRRLLTANADPNVRQDGMAGRSALGLAASQGHAEVALMLLAAGARVDDNDRGGLTPLMVAAAAANVGRDGEKIVDGASVDAYAERTLGVAKILISKGAVVDRKGGKDGDTALGFAAMAGRADMVQMLLEAGADPNIANRKGHTPLLRAAAHADSTAAELLLDAGGDPNTASDRGFTPLMQAAHYGNDKVGMLLLDRGADPTVERGKTRWDRTDALKIARKQRRFAFAEMMQTKMKEL